MSNNEIRKEIESIKRMRTHFMVAPECNAKFIKFCDKRIIELESSLRR